MKHLTRTLAALVLAGSAAAIATPAHAADYVPPASDSSAVCTDPAYWTPEACTFTIPVAGLRVRYSPDGRATVVGHLRPRYYRVKHHDTLWHIAAVYYDNGHDYVDLMNRNHLRSTRIYVGQVLRLW